MKIGKSTILHFISQIVTSIAGFIATFTIARFLGAEGVGIYALGVALVTWVKIPCVGIHHALNKRISEGIAKDKYLTAGIILNISVVIVISILILFFRHQVNRYLGLPLTQFIVAVLVVDVVFMTFGFALQGHKRVAEFGWIKAVERTLRALIQITVAVMGYGIAELFLGHAIALLVGSVISLYYLKPQILLPKKKHFRNLLEYGIYGWSDGLKGKTFGWMDTIILGFFVGSSLIGIYEVAWTLASFFVLVANSVQSTLFPELSELSTDGREDRIHHYLNEGMVFTGIFLIPGFFGGLAVGTDILRIYRPEFTQGAVVLILLITARMFDAYGKQFVSAINAVDKPEVAFRVNGAFVILNLSLNVLLISQIGWYGAAAATLISGLISLILGYRALSNLIGRPKVPYGEILRQFFAGLAMFGVVIGADQFFPTSHIGTIALVGFGAIVYLVVLLAVSTRIRRKMVSMSGVF